MKLIKPADKCYSADFSLIPVSGNNEVIHNGDSSWTYSFVSKWVTFWLEICVVRFKLLFKLS